ncbi:MAG: acyltransferase [Acidobacteria bacterium]|nr:acyltransferase [Acidobacteriota bacterium]
MERVSEIDGLRALAALSVFVHHVFGFPAIVRITGAGWIGVDLFFVISGYLITTILLEMRDDPHYFKNFYMRRTLRIFPPYYAFFLICISCAALAGSYHFSWRLWGALAFYGTSLVATLPWFPGAFARLPDPARAIEVTWSLSIEELFYLLWAPAVRFIKREHLGILLFAIILLAPAVRYYVHTPGNRTEYYFFPARMDSLAFGALFAVYRGRFRMPAKLGYLFGIGMVSSSLMLLFVADPQRNPWFSVCGYTVIAFTMTLALAYVLDRSGGNTFVCRILRSRALLKLGTVSYMFYLLHLFVIKVFRTVFADILVSHWALNRILQVTGSFAVTYILAALSWRYFESPILRLKSKFVSGTANRIQPLPVTDQQRESLETV